MVFANDRVYPLNHLPNQHGFKFIGVRKNNTFAECFIEKGADGMHRVTGEADYIDLQGWKYKPK